MKINRIFLTLVVTFGFLLSCTHTVGKTGNKEKKIENIIAETALKFMGEFGISKAGFMILSDSWNGKKGIIKINSKYVDEIKMVLGLIKGNIIVNTVGVSGTLKRSKQKFMEKEE